MSKKQRDSKAKKSGKMTYDANLFERIAKAFKPDYKSKSEISFDYGLMDNNYKSIKMENGLYKMQEKKSSKARSERNQYGPTLREMMDKVEDLNLHGVDVPKEFFDKPIKKIIRDVEGMEKTLNTRSKRCKDNINKYKSLAVENEKEAENYQKLITKAIDENKPLSRMQKGQYALALDAAEKNANRYSGVWSKYATAFQRNEDLRVHNELVKDGLKDMASNENFNGMTGAEVAKVLTTLGYVIKEHSETGELDNSEYENIFDEKVKDMDELINDVWNRTAREKKRLSGEIEEDKEEEA